MTLLAEAAHAVQAPAPTPTGTGRDIEDIVLPAGWETSTHWNKDQWVATIAQHLASDAADPGAIEWFWTATTPGHLLARTGAWIAPLFGERMPQRSDQVAARFHFTSRAEAIAAARQAIDDLSIAGRTLAAWDAVALRAASPAPSNEPSPVTRHACARSHR